MTQYEIQIALQDAAMEDVAYARENGILTICGTKVGNITLELINDVLIAKNDQGAAMTGPYMTESALVKWLSQKYIVEM